MKWFEVFKNNVITFGWQLFALLSNIEEMLLLGISHRYNPKIFIKNLKEATSAREKRDPRGKTEIV